VLPISTLYAGAGNPDHHALLALLAAGYLGLSLTLVRRNQRGLSLLTAGTGLALIRMGVALIWSGSALFLIVGESSLLLAGCLRGQGRLLRVQALGAAAAAVGLAPAVAWGGEPLGGWFSASDLSWLQPLLLGTVAWTAGGLALLERRWATRGAAARLAGAAVLALFPWLIVLGVTPLWEGVAPAFEYLGRSGSFARNAEQVALYAPWRVGPEHHAHSASQLYGGFAYLLPLLPLPILLRGLRQPDPSLMAVLMVWIVSIGALAILQIRWGSDFAPAGSIGFAIALAQLRPLGVRLLPGAARFLPYLMALLGLLLLAPIWNDFYADRVRNALSARSDPAVAARLIQSNVHVAAARFARLVRAATPETRGFLDPEQRPEYGVLCPAELGHVLRYEARRAVPAGPFGPQFDSERYEAVNRFYAATSEDEAVGIAARLEARYVVVHAQHAGKEKVVRRLYVREGSWSPLWRQLGRFRLVTEGPARGGLPFVGGSVSIPFKLFEIVEGAVLVGQAPPGTMLTATLRLRTPERELATYRATVRADDDGVARVRVPYATDQRGDVQALGPYRVELDGRELDIAITERQVLDGAEVHLGTAR